MQKKYLKTRITLIILCLTISYLVSSFAPNIILDNDGIPSVYYGTTIDGEPIGFHRNPVTTAIQANEFYDKYKENNDESSKMYFLNNADWLVDNAINKGYFFIITI